MNQLSIIFILFLLFGYTASSARVIQIKHDINQNLKTIQSKSLEASECNSILSFDIKNQPLQEELQSIESKNKYQPQIIISSFSKPILYLIITLELLISLAVFVKLGREYLKSNQPYFSKAVNPLSKFS